MKNIFGICLILLICLGANAQVQFGIRGGALLSSFNYKLKTENIKTKNILNYQGGFQINAKLGNLFGFSTGFLYSVKGSEVKEIQEGGRFNISYLDIPLFLETRFGTGKVNTFIETGVNLSVALNGTFDNGVNSLKDIKFGNKEDEISFTDYSASFGGGVNLSKLRLGFNYNLGLKDITNTSAKEIKNTSMLLYAVLFF